VNREFEAAVRAHRYLAEHHSRGGAIVGPDCGIRFNYRVGRFVKGYVAGRSWADDYAYIQAQGYWILGNWRLHSLTGDPAYRDLAIACSRYVVAAQRADGAWEYPNPEWKGRVATTEGSWGSLGLLESYARTRDEPFLASALRWYAFLVDRIGFEEGDGVIAVRYFADRRGALVPNNTPFLLRLLAQLAAVTGDRSYLDRAGGLVRFVGRAQRDDGELPYTVRGLAGGPDTAHFQCFQYNAFQCLDLIAYHALSGDPEVVPVVRRLADFLVRGVAADGHVRYDCTSTGREIVYHAAVVSAALRAARRLGAIDYEEAARRAAGYVLGLQRPDGSFPFSRREHRVLADRRAYPRNIAMMIHHLLQGGQAEAKP
jgi:hypothetical protein